METLKKIAEILRNNDFFYILTHIYPDGDTLGSAYSLCEALQQIGKHAKVLTDTNFPDKFDFLKSNIKMENFEPKYIISVDIAEKILIPDNLKKFESSINLCIDHHIKNTINADISYTDHTAAANCEIIYFLLKEMNIKIDKSIAASLYTGISTDTGCFKYSNTTSQSHFIVSELLKCGFPMDTINENLFIKKSKKKIETEKILNKNLEFSFDNKCAVTHITTDEMQSINIGENELDGIASLPISIENVDIGITMREKLNGEYKISVRTSNKINANEFCENFGGGGHSRAAGFSSFEDISKIKEKIKNTLTLKFGW